MQESFVHTGNISQTSFNSKAMLWRRLENRRKRAFERALESTRAVSCRITRPAQYTHGCHSLSGMATPRQVDRSSHMSGAPIEGVPQQNVAGSTCLIPTTSWHKTFNAGHQYGRRQPCPGTSSKNQNTILGTPRYPRVPLPKISFENKCFVSTNTAARPCGMISTNRAPNTVQPKVSEPKKDTGVPLFPPKVPETGILTIMNNYDPTNVLPYIHFLETLRSPEEESGRASEPRKDTSDICGPEMNDWLLSLLPKGKAIVLFRSLVSPSDEDLSLLARCVRYARSERGRKFSWAVHPTHIALIMERTNGFGPRDKYKYYATKLRLRDPNVERRHVAVAS